MMKSSAFYMNIGRGETTDTDALLHALQKRQIAGAGLDVLEQEPLPETHPLWTMDNVFITPHTAGLTQHYDQRVMDIFLTNLKSYLSIGVRILNRVDLNKQY